MATTNAERQKKFREKNKNKTERLDMRVSNEAAFALECLAKNYRVTKKKFLEDLLINIHHEKLSKMTADEMNEYLGLETDVTR